MTPRYDEHFKAYVAGFFDGEGTVGLYYFKKRRQWVAGAYLEQRASKKTASLLQRIAQHYGIRATLNTYSVRLQIRRKATLLRFLNDIIPYAVLKKEELVLLRAWLLDPGYAKRINQTLTALKNRKENYGNGK